MGVMTNVLRIKAAMFLPRGGARIHVLIKKMQVTEEMMSMYHLLDQPKDIGEKNVKVGLKADRV
jgi:hypothetical protein